MGVGIQRAGYSINSRRKNRAFNEVHMLIVAMLSGKRPGPKVAHLVYIRKVIRKTLSPYSDKGV